MQPTPNPVQELLSLYTQRRFVDMERLARDLLKQGIAAPILDELLGMALAAQNRFAEALPFLQKAVDAVPVDAQFLENLGNCQRELARFEAAEQSLRKSLAIRPDATPTMNTLASVLRLQNRRAEARELFDRILTLAPHDAVSHFNLGNMLKEEGQVAAAEEQFRLAIAANPNITVFYEDLATVLMALGKFPEAEVYLRKAGALNPSGPRSFALLAGLLANTLRKLEAITCADAAVQRIGTMTPELIEKNMGLFDVIAEAYSVAGAYGSAAKIFKEFIARQPAPLRLIAAYTSLRWTCDWEAAATIEPDLIKAIRSDDSVSSGAHIISIMPTATAEDQLIAMKRMAAPFQTSARGTPALVRRNRNNDAFNRRIRIGYLSSDFCNHVISYLITGVMETHDKSQFEIVACDFSPPSQDSYRKRLEAAFERWLPIRELSDVQAAQRIADEEIDILIDLMGWTAGHRAPILALRPAPLQIFWLGIAGTTGAPWIDYNIADRIVIPQENERYFSEKIIRLPDTYLPIDTKKSINRTLTRRDYGLPEDGVVFCSFNAAFKFTDEIFKLWMRLLRDVPRSVLWLQEPTMEAQESLRSRARAQGVEPDRVLFAARMPEVADHLARTAQADIALDCFPYGSHTTATDALLVGVPLVALMGETFASRVSASVVAAANLPDLVTSSYEEYYALAFKLATDRSALERIKQRTRDARKNSPLFDTARFTRNLETGYRSVWGRHLAGGLPSHVNVAAEGISVENGAAN